MLYYSNKIENIHINYDNKLITINSNKYWIYWLKTSDFIIIQNLPELTSINFFIPYKLSLVCNLDPNNEIKYCDNQMIEKFVYRCKKLIIFS